jgi:hypothetical protein
MCKPYLVALAVYKTTKKSKQNKGHVILSNTCPLSTFAEMQHQNPNSNYALIHDGASYEPFYGSLPPETDPYVMPQPTPPPSVYSGTRSQSSPGSVVVTGNSFAAGSAKLLENQPPASYLAGTSPNQSWIPSRTANSVPGGISSVRRSGGFRPAMLPIRPPASSPYRVHKPPSSRPPQRSHDDSYGLRRLQPGQGLRIDGFSQYEDSLPPLPLQQSGNMSHMQPISQTQSYPAISQTQSYPDLQAEHPPPSLHPSGRYAGPIPRPVSQYSTCKCENAETPISTSLS